MRFATLIAAVALAILATLPAPAGACAERAQPGVRRDRAAALAGRAGGPRDLDVRHRLQRPLLHLHLPAAPRRGDRLVRHPRRRASRRPLRGLGGDPRSRLLHPGRSGLPGALGHRDLGLPLVPGRRRSSSPSSAARATATRPATSRTRPSTPRPRTAPPTSARAPATSTSAPPPARSACGSSPTRASTPAAWEKIGGWEGYAAFLSDDPDEPRQPAEPALGRLGRAAVPHRHGLRRLPHRLRAGQPAGRPDASRPGRTSTRWSATSTAASPSSSAAASRRTGWSGSSSPAPGRASSTPRRCRWTSSPTRAR